MRRFAIALLLCADVAQSWAYDVAFLAAPRTTGKFATQSLSEVDGPYAYQPGAQLILRTEDGAERVLVDGNVLDFSFTLDGQAILYSQVTRPKASDDWQRGDDGRRADVFKIDITSGDIVRLTDGDSWNCQPVECGDGSIAFLSSRDGWINPHESYRALTIYKMNADGADQHRIWHAGLGGVFGLSLGPDGRLYFASGENQGFNGGGGENWSIWSINPDGSDFQPELSGMHRGNVNDWPVIASRGSLVFSRYYDTRIYGMILAAPVVAANPQNDGPTKFGNPLARNNPYFKDSKGSHPFSWQRRGLYNLTPLGTEQDEENRATVNGVTVQSGMYSHPWPIPGNGVYLTWTGDEGDAAMDLGVYAVPDITNTVDDNAELVKVMDLPTRHEWMGKAAVPFAAIYGADPPTPTCPKAESLPLGSPYGVIGTSAVDVNEWVSGPDWKEGEQQLVPMLPDEAEWVRVLAFNPTRDFPWAEFELVTNGDAGHTVKVGNTEGLISEINERVGFYDELIPIKKWRKPDGSLYLGPDPQDGSIRVMREDGRPDTSWAAEVPADQPWSLQLLNAKKEAIHGSTAQTWHQVISREQRTNCQGCHAHWRPDQTPFEATLAASSGYPRLRLSTVRTVVYERDIAPLGLGIPQRPWQGTYRTYESGTQSLDDDPSFTEEEAELIRAWQDTGFMAAGKFTDGSTIQPEDGLGPYADTMDPTLVVSDAEEGLVVGACDPQSGIDRASLVVTLNGRGVTNRFVEVEPFRWICAARLGRGLLKVSIADHAGNRAQVEIGQAGYRPQRPDYRPPGPQREE